MGDDRLGEYLVKNFNMNDERVKQSGGAYFDELWEHVRDIRLVLKPTVYALK